MSGGSLIRDAKTDKATLAKVPDVTAAPAAIPEAVTDVFVAEHTRDFPQLGVGSAGWLGGRLLAATRGTINLNMSVLDQVRMEPMLWLAAAGLQCDRAFHARRTRGASRLRQCMCSQHSLALVVAAIRWCSVNMHL